MSSAPRSNSPISRFLTSVAKNEGPVKKNQQQEHESVNDDPSPNTERLYKIYGKNVQSFNNSWTQYAGVPPGVNKRKAYEKLAFSRGIVRANGNWFDYKRFADDLNFIRSQVIHTCLQLGVFHSVDILASDKVSLLGGIKAIRVSL